MKIKIGVFHNDDINLASVRLRSFYLFDYILDQNIEIFRNINFIESFKCKIIHIHMKYKPADILKIIFYRILNKTVIFDLDVIGGINIKKQYPSECLSIFIMPPSLTVLEERLQKRGSESADSLQKRIAKAKGEIARSEEFDKVILNDDFAVACRETMEVIQKFIG